MLKSKKSQYRDKEKLREYINRQRKLNYDIGRQGCYPHAWTVEEDEYIITSELTDREIAKQIHHSVNAIQKRRWVLKKKGRL